MSDPIKQVWPIESALLTEWCDPKGEQLVHVKYIGCKKKKYIPKSYLVDDESLAEIIGN